MPLEKFTLNNLTGILDHTKFKKRKKFWLKIHEKNFILCYCFAYLEKTWRKHCKKLGQKFTFHQSNNS